MKPTGRLQLIADLRDLQIVDCDQENCGIVDDLELTGKPGGKLEVKAILVGPGAYRNRLPRWLAWLVALVAGEGLVRVPWGEVESIGSVVLLRRSATELGLGRADRRLAAKMPSLGVMDASGRA
jgi:sporulation protein YlmC with PRC-barrel domain